MMHVRWRKESEAEVAWEISQRVNLIPSIMYYKSFYWVNVRCKLNFETFAPRSFTRWNFGIPNFADGGMQTAAGGLFHNSKNFGCVSLCFNTIRRIRYQLRSCCRRDERHHPDVVKNAISARK